jgi:hypothetical protein
MSDKAAMLISSGLVVIAILSGCTSAVGQSVSGHYQVQSISSAAQLAWIRLNLDTGEIVFCVPTGCSIMKPPMRRE